MSKESGLQPEEIVRLLDEEGSMNSTKPWLMLAILLAVPVRIGWGGTLGSAP